MSDKYSINVTINDEDYTSDVEARMLLSDFIRHELGLTGTHVGCEHGVCGACTILGDGVVSRACLTFAVQVDGTKIQTAEGLTVVDGELTDLQKAFKKHHGLQCGDCTPGILMAVTAYLEENPKPTEEEIRDMLSGHLCRCTGYVGIVKAILDYCENRDG